MDGRQVVLPAVRQDVVHRAHLLVVLDFVQAQAEAQRVRDPLVLVLGLTYCNPVTLSPCDPRPPQAYDAKRKACKGVSAVFPAPLHMCQRATGTTHACMTPWVHERTLHPLSSVHTSKNEQTQPYSNIAWRWQGLASPHRTKEVIGTPFAGGLNSDAPTAWVRVSEAMEARGTLCTSTP